MSTIRICTVVTGRTLGEFLNNLENIQKISDFVELRVDYIKNLSINDVEMVKKHTIKTSIFTCRKKSEGGLYESTEEERKKIIEKAYGMGFDYIDVELSSIENLNSSKRTKIKIIQSFHDFTKTPSLDELERIKNNMKKHPHTIMKFSTYIVNKNDIKTLLTFLLHKQDNEEMIVLGMGKQGRALRIFGPLVGSYLTFASTSYSQSSPEQLTIDEMKNMYKFLI